VGVVWLYQGEKLRNKTLACTMFMPLQRVFLAALMALIPVKESFCTTCSDFHVRKRLAESLVLSRLDYCASVYLPLPGYLLKRLQKIEFAAASFVYGRYVNDKVQLAPS
ncbi:unnamed protein product, partial [Porites evermanni]